MESEKWEVNLEVLRRPGDRHKGYITHNQFTDFFMELQAWALKQGYAITGQPKPGRRNCPHCGRILRHPPGQSLTHCPLCREPLAARLAK